MVLEKIGPAIKSNGSSSGYPLKNVEKFIMALELRPIYK